MYSNYLRFMLNTENIQSLIDSGEGYNVEFKVRVPSKVRELTEEICAFANADGGYLLIGVDDNGQVIDTNLENDKRSAIQGSISEISPALHCELYSVNIGDKTIWVLMFRPARTNLIYFPVLSMCVRERTRRNFAQPKKCAASFRNVTKSFLTIYPAIGSISTRMQTNR